MRAGPSAHHVGEFGPVVVGEGNSVIAPDAAAFDWDQWRVTAGFVVLFSRGADLENLPPAIRRMPGGRNDR